ncbi:MAG: hypothetical protein JNJ61_17575 [Anaerolineae bacterium]|nr:hypothetical protein [Anaerolineae bacterium]
MSKVLQRAILPIWVGLLTLMFTVTVQATTSNPAYFIAADSDGVQQVYQVLIDGQSEPRQITYTTSDVITFGVAYDGLAIAYMSEGQLWLQPIHTEESQALTAVQTAQFFSPPVFSPDGQYIAYADGGVWLMDLGTRETRQLLVDVDLTGPDDPPSEFRRYEPQQFVLGPNGRVEKLVIDVGVWGWDSAGVYDLATGAFVELEGQVHTNILPLDGGFALVYGNTGVAGEPALSIAPSLDQINEAVEVLRFADLTDEILFFEQAVEIAPQVVRVYGQTISQTPGDFGIFYFDYNLISGADAVNFITVAEPGQESARYGRLSPDGALLPVYVNPVYGDHGTILGTLHLVDMVNGGILAVELPEAVGIWGWQS